MKFSNLRLSLKLAIAFGIVLSIMMIGFGFVYMQTLRLSEIERENGLSDDVVDRIDIMSADLNAARASVQKLVLSGAAADNAETESKIVELTQKISALKTILEKEAPEFLPDLDSYRLSVAAYVNQAINQEEVLAADPATRPQAVEMVISPKTKPLIKAVDNSFAALREKVSKWSDNWTAAGERGMGQTKWTVLASGLLSMLLGALMSWLVTRAVGRPLVGMTDAMRSLARGDHTITVPARDQSDELGEMAKAVQVFKEAAIEKVRLEADAEAARRTADGERTDNEAVRAEAAGHMTQVVDGLATGLTKLASGDLIYRLNQPFSADYEGLRDNFNAAVAQLQETMKSVSANTGAISSGTAQISTAADDLSRRTEQQAASLQETAAALSEITSAVKQTAEGAAHAREVVKIATSDAERSGAVVNRTVAAMSRIEQSASQIGSIIGVIDEIAFQTNLLALNAGVEAARAGEAGRGFAVVASEVRALAQRSAEAAKEIKTLIAVSDQEVTAGVQLVGETGKGLAHIIEQIVEISKIVGEIASSAEHQATGIAEVNIAIRQMDQVTQQNAAMVEEATAATHSLASDSAQLAMAVGRFQVGGAVQSMTSTKPRVVTPSSRPAHRVVSRSGGGGAAQAGAAASDWQEF